MTDLFKLVISDETDIPDNLRQDAFRMYNKVNEQPVWLTLTKLNRQIVLDGLREFWYQFSIKLERLESHRDIARADRLNLWVANNHFTGVKESSHGCSSCRSRMFNRLKNLIK